MKRLLALFTAGALASGTAAVGLSSVPKTAPPRTGVFIHISHGADDPGRLLSGLDMATRMAGRQELLVYFDLGAVEPVLAGAEPVTMPGYPTSSEALQSLRSKGITLLVSPAALAAAGKSPEHLAEGVRVAEEALFFSFTRGRILSLNY